MNQRMFYGLECRIDLNTGEQKCIHTTALATYRPAYIFEKHGRVEIHRIYYDTWADAKRAKKSLLACSWL